MPRATAAQIKEAVDDYITSNESLRVVAARHNISFVTLNRWVESTPGIREEDARRKRDQTKIADVKYIQEHDELQISYGRMMITLPRADLMRRLDMLFKVGLPDTYIDYSGKETSIGIRKG